MSKMSFTFFLVLSLLFVLVSSVHGHFMSGMKLSNNILVDGNGNTLKFQGVDRSGTEYACIQGFGFEDGPFTTASFQTIQTWAVNIIRVPLNEDCWLSGPNSNPTYSGQNYISFIQSLVNTILSLNMGVILELHWTSGGGVAATAQQAMPNTQFSLNFWTSVANTFGNQTGVIFDLFNEPFPGFPGSDWNCWLNGGTCSGISFQVAGMQQLVNTVRNTGATNLLMLGGCQYANDASGWLRYKPTDPLNFLAAAIHTYNFNTCNNQVCWDTYYKPLAAAVPVIAGEFGETDGTGNFVNTIIPYFQANGIHYLAWVWTLNQSPTLILDYSGTVNGAFGAAVKAIYTGGTAATTVAPATAAGATTTTTVAGTTNSAGCSSIVPVGTTCMATPNCCPSGQYCYEKNQYYAGCFNIGTCTVGIHSDDPVAFQTPWSCTLLTTVTAATTTTAGTTRTIPTTSTVTTTTRATVATTTATATTKSATTAATTAGATTTVMPAPGSNGNIWITVTASAFNPQCSNGQWALFGLNLNVMVSVQLFGGMIFTQQPMAETLNIDAAGDLAVLEMSFYVNGVASTVTVSNTFNVAASMTSGNTWSFMLEDDQPNIGGNIFVGSCGSQAMSAPTITAAFTSNTFIQGLGSSAIPAVSALPQVVNYLATVNRATATGGATVPTTTVYTGTTAAPGVNTTTMQPTIATAATTAAQPTTVTTVMPATLPLVAGTGPQCVLTLTILAVWSNGAIINAAYTACNPALSIFTTATISLPGYVATNMYGGVLHTSSIAGQITFGPSASNANLGSVVGFVAYTNPSAGVGVPTGATLDGTSVIFGGGQSNIAASAVFATQFMTVPQGTISCPIVGGSAAQNTALTGAVQNYCMGMFDVVVNGGTTPAPTLGTSNGNSNVVVIGAVVGGVAGVVLIASIVFYFTLCRRDRGSSLKKMQFGGSASQVAPKVTSGLPSTLDDAASVQL